MPSQPDLTGVHLKLDRAEHHIQTLREEVEAFKSRDPSPWSFETQERPGAGDSVEYVLTAVVREPPPREWTLIIGDAIQNMRSALEHLAYELSTPAGRRKGTAFPIFTDECEFKVRGVPKIATIRVDERKLIERVQPFNASKVPRGDPLAVLSKLSNLDKHRLLVTVVAAVEETESWVASENAEVEFTFIEWGAVRDGARIVALKATRVDPAKPMSVQPTTALGLHIADSGAHFRRDAVGFLEVLHHYIAHDVIEMWFRHGVMLPHWSEVEPAPEVAAEGQPDE